MEIIEKEFFKNNCINIKKNCMNLLSWDIIRIRFQKVRKSSLFETEYESNWYEYLNINQIRIRISNSNFFNQYSRLFESRIRGRILVLK